MTPLLNVPAFSGAEAGCAGCLSAPTVPGAARASQAGQRRATRPAPETSPRPEPIPAGDLAMLTANLLLPPEMIAIPVCTEGRPQSKLGE